MDGSRFDSLARSLAGTGSRRGFLGGLLGLGAGLVGVSVTDAACRPGQVSLRGRGRCVCKTTGRPPVDGACPCPKGLSDTGDGQGCVACHTDGDCPTGDACVPSACVAGACARTKTTCDDGQGLCTTKACDPALGSVYTPVDCADGNVCTLDACDPVAGCQHPPAPDGLTAGCDGVCCDGQCQVCCTNADCTLPETCGGGGVAGECGCAPTFGADDCDGVTCGNLPTGCGGTVPCGCLGLETCGGGGVAGTCGCTALTYDQACGTECIGTVSDGCGGSHLCSCPASCPVIELATPACFWMDCDGIHLDAVPGFCCWVLIADLLDRPPYSQAECQELDGCFPGGGLFGLGDACYKWATTSDPEDVSPW